MLRLTSWFALVALVGAGVLCGAEAGTYRDAVLADAPIGYWRLGDSSGNARNEVTAALDGTFQSGATRGATGLLVGDTDDAVSMAGAEGYVSISTPYYTGSTNAYSFEAWIRPTQPVAGDSREQSILSKPINDGGTGTGIDLLLTPDGKPRFLVQGVANSVSDTALEADETYHVVGTMDWDGVAANATITLYVNGLIASGLSAQTTASGAAFGGSLAEVFIGRELVTPALSRHFDGVIDEVAIYDHALSAERVAVHFGLGDDGPDPVPEPGAALTLVLLGPACVARSRRRG